MDILTLVGIIAAIVGIIAGAVQIIEYLQKRRGKPAALDHSTPLAPASTSPQAVDAALKKNALQSKPLTQLHQICIERFDTGELETLCFNLGVDYDVLPGDGKADKVRELIEYLGRRNRIPELIEIGKRSRPDISWGRISELLVETSPLFQSISLEQPLPHNLPPRNEFVGRETEKAQVHEALRSRSRLVSVDGIGGIGKTALALEVAYECLRVGQSDSPADGIATFDGFIWTTAKDRDLTLNDLLDAIARTLDYPGIAQKSAEEKPTAVLKLLRARPYLLIVDNFETITKGSVRDFLLSVPEPSKALITTREQKLLNAWIVSLKHLTESEGLALIRSEGKRLGLASVKQAKDGVLLPLYQAAGGAPLAIKWATGQIKQRGQSLDIVLAVLHEAEGDIFDNIFARSWGLLSADARQVLIVMPIFATSASRAGIEAASDVHHFVLDEALGELVEMSLVDATDELDLARRRYSIHPLTRSFARARLSANSAFEQEARLRLATYYAERCKEFGRWNDTSGFPWFRAELLNILAILEWANRAQKWNAIISIFSHLYFFLGTSGYWQERVKYGQITLEAAQKAGDRFTMAMCQHALGWIFWKQGRYADAEEPLKSSIQSYRDLGNKRESAWAMVTLAKVRVAQGKLDRAHEIIDEAKRTTDDDSYRSLAKGLLTVQGRIEKESGNLTAAWTSLLRALKATEDTESWMSIGSRHIDLGHVALEQDQLDQAADHFEQGLKSSQEYHRQDNIAKAKFGLARVLVLRGNKPEAIERALSAREQFVRMDMEREIREVDDFLCQMEYSEEQYE